MINADGTFLSVALWHFVPLEYLLIFTYTDAVFQHTTRVYLHNTVIAVDLHDGYDKNRS
jgi:hypothetical protein